MLATQEFLIGYKTEENIPHQKARLKITNTCIHVNTINNNFLGVSSFSLKYTKLNYVCKGTGNHWFWSLKGVSNLFLYNSHWE